MLQPKPLISNPENWIVPGGSNQEVKQKLLFRNLSIAIDNKVENLVAEFINEYFQNKQGNQMQAENSDVNQEES
jgi:hypothetical protein